MNHTKTSSLYKSAKRGTPGRRRTRWLKDEAVSRANLNTNLHKLKPRWRSKIMEGK